MSGRTDCRHFFLRDETKKTITKCFVDRLCPKFVKAHLIKGLPFSFVEPVEDVMLNKSGRGVYFVVMLGVKYPQAAY